MAFFDVTASGWKDETKSALKIYNSIVYAGDEDEARHEFCEEWKDKLTEIAGAVEFSVREIYVGGLK